MEHTRKHYNINRKSQPVNIEKKLQNMLNMSKSGLINTTYMKVIYSRRHAPNPKRVLPTAKFTS